MSDLSDWGSDPDDSESVPAISPFPQGQFDLPQNEVRSNSPISLPPSGYPSERWEAADEGGESTKFSLAEDEPFNLLKAQKLGIVGGKGVGKSYLLHAIVYRTYSAVQSCALSNHLKGIRLFCALNQDGKAFTLNPLRFLRRYMAWERLAQTTTANQLWYRLRLNYKAGLFGTERSAMDVEFFDGSGEYSCSAGARELWRGYLDARIMVFCLPLWAVFPAADLSRNSWRWRSDLLEGFEQVVQNYMDVRAHTKQAPPVKSILMLTMADDQRSTLKTLYERWIRPCIEFPNSYLRQLQSGPGIARYLANARRVSSALHKEFGASHDPRISSIPHSLDFGSGRPWLIPVSAVSGAQLEEVERNFPDPIDRPPLVAPVPVHVELPLLLAMCERHNALM